MWQQGRYFYRMGIAKKSYWRTTSWLFGEIDQCYTLFKPNKCSVVWRQINSWLECSGTVNVFAVCQGLASQAWTCSSWKQCCSLCRHSSSEILIFGYKQSHSGMMLKWTWQRAHHYDTKCSSGKCEKGSGGWVERGRRPSGSARSGGEEDLWGWGAIWKKMIGKDG